MRIGSVYKCMANGYGVLGDDVRLIELELGEKVICERRSGDGYVCRTVGGGEIWVYNLNICHFEEVYSTDEAGPLEGG